MKKLSIILFLSLIIVITTHADDTELYVGNVDAASSGRPKVLIILDNSGSMNTMVPGSPPSYDPTNIYPNQGSILNSRIYWSYNATPPGKDSDNYIQVDSNRCASSQNSLDTTGMYTDNIAVWRKNKKNVYRWRKINDSSGTRNSAFVDCKSDFDNSIVTNPGDPVQADGYPLNTSSGPYTHDKSSSKVPWSKRGPVNLFSANYMNWYHNKSLASSDRPRISIAKEVVKNIIDSNPSIDFGLMVFNQNGTYGPHGGRVVTGIKEGMTDADRTGLKNTITSINAESWTPLCETMYEAYRYFSGGAVYFGDDASSPSPPRDTTIESSGNYVSPMGDCQQVYVILMTDGAPTKDTNADSLVGSLGGIGTVSGNRLDELAGWMYSNDLDNDDSNGVQRAITYTIGFAIDHQLLSDTAKKGGGRYYTADDSAELTSSFQGALNEILITDTTFTSPAVAVNSFNRSRSLDDIYIAMFRPEVGPRWAGNLKKLSIDSNGRINDSKGSPAIDPTTGNIRDTAHTYWSANPDGGRVLSGGAGELLANRDPATRVMKTNTGTGGALQNFNTSNTALTATLFNVIDDTAKNEMINWARGVDIDDEDIDELTTDTRPWLIGDPLHSQPLVLNFGARSGFTKTNPDIRILMGTNYGVLHMFGASDGHEDWAFLPKELLHLNKVLRENSTSVDHPYGIDGSVVAHVVDSNNDGTISGSDKVYIYFGLRRGGDKYYALDISDPDNPSFLWSIDSGTSGFSELGQSWSTPTITKIPGHSNPVLVVGGGYDDANKDGYSVPVGNDTQGRGIFVIDAINGSLVWSITPADNSGKNMKHSGLTESIPAPISVYDSNGDGLTDRIYAADTGGNIWRVDMPGNSFPTSTQTTWSIYKLAELGGNTSADDRRFFNKIDVIRTRYGTLAYDGIAIGSGNRAHPNEKDVNDRFYMIRDTKVVTEYHGTGGASIPSAFTHNSLYNITQNLIQQGNETEQEAALQALFEKNGWYMDLGKTGEKSLSSSLTLDGTVYFTTFAPDSTATSCVPIPGYGYLYAVNLHWGTAVFDWDITTGLTKEDRDVGIGGRLPDTVTPHFGEDTIRIIGVGAGEEGKGSYDTGGSLKTEGVYWYKETE